MWHPEEVHLKIKDQPNYYKCTACSMRNETYWNPTWIIAFPNGDKYHNGTRFLVSPAHQRNFDNLLESLTKRLEPSFGAVRQVYSPFSGRTVQCLRDLQPNHKYVAAGNEKLLRISSGYLTSEEKVKKKHICKHKTKSRHHLEDNKQKPHFDDYSNISARYFVDAEKHRKGTITVFVHRNGDFHSRPIRLVLTEKERCCLLWWGPTIQTISQRLNIGPIRAFYTRDGVKVHTPCHLKNGWAYVAVARLEKFINVPYKSPDGIPFACCLEKESIRCLVRSLPQYCIHHGIYDTKPESTNKDLVAKEIISSDTKEQKETNELKEPKKEALKEEKEQNGKRKKFVDVPFISEINNTSSTGGKGVKIENKIEPKIIKEEKELQFAKKHDIKTSSTGEREIKIENIKDNVEPTIIKEEKELQFAKKNDIKTSSAGDKEIKIENTKDNVEPIIIKEERQLPFVKKKDVSTSSTGEKEIKIENTKDNVEPIIIKEEKELQFAKKNDIKTSSTGENEIKIENTKDNVEPIIIKEERQLPFVKKKDVSTSSTGEKEIKIENTKDNVEPIIIKEKRQLTFVKKNNIPFVNKNNVSTSSTGEKEIKIENTKDDVEPIIIKEEKKLQFAKKNDINTSSTTEKETKIENKKDNVEPIIIKEEKELQFAKKKCCAVAEVAENENKSLQFEEDLRKYCEQIKSKKEQKTQTHYINENRIVNGIKKDDKLLQTEENHKERDIYVTKDEKTEDKNETVEKIQRESKMIRCFSYPWICHRKSSISDINKIKQPNVRDMATQTEDLNRYLKINMNLREEETQTEYKNQNFKMYGNVREMETQTKDGNQYFEINQIKGEKETQTEDRSEVSTCLKEETPNQSLTWDGLSEDHERKTRKLGKIIVRYKQIGNINSAPEQSKFCSKHCGRKKRNKTIPRPWINCYKRKSAHKTGDEKSKQEPNSSCWVRKCRFRRNWRRYQNKVSKQCSCHCHWDYYFDYNDEFNSNKLNFKEIIIPPVNDKYEHPIIMDDKDPEYEMITRVEEASTFMEPVIQTKINDDKTQSIARDDIQIFEVIATNRPLSKSFSSYESDSTHPYDTIIPDKRQTPAEKNAYKYGITKRNHANENSKNDKKEVIIDNFYQEHVQEDEKLGCLRNTSEDNSKTREESDLESVCSNTTFTLNQVDITRNNDILEEKELMGAIKKDDTYMRRDDTIYKRLNKPCEETVGKVSIATQTGSEMEMTEEDQALEQEYLQESFEDYTENESDADY